MRRKLFCIALMLTAMVSQAYAQMTMSFPNISGGGQQPKHLIQAARL